MRSLINLNKDLLEDYSAFSSVNENWSILSYLNYKYDLNSALAFSKLFFPDFIINKGCIIIDFLYSSKNLDEWYEEFNGNVSLTEKMCNLYEIKDFFHINSEDESEEKIKEFGGILQSAWKLNVAKLFPEINVIIDLIDRDESYYITLYTVDNI
ncbi:hypothetical protein [Siphonobacter curvatus]|uniref:Uncharacterized protein n=1 Tax=Siphonobacter curvatus TaxID=2094562 RepID=A0A2S7IF56_9BACT|nr:hypothetical protein [Siphonobacter curvatus]PQA53421.1 hypothetical protein C5O19_24560 [Siphonobacter curvatus]